MKRSLYLLFYRTVFNFWPCIRGTGAWITRISQDFRELDVKLPLSWRTRNRVGTIFGGSIYASVDPFYMIMLMEILGRDFVVWDKGARVRFKRPGTNTLYAKFRLDSKFTDELKARVLKENEVTFERDVHFSDASGLVHAEITKEIYVATKTFYKKKIAARKEKVPKKDLITNHSH